MPDVLIWKHLRWVFVQLQIRKAVNWNRFHGYSTFETSIQLSPKAWERVLYSQFLSLFKRIFQFPHILRNQDKSVWSYSETCRTWMSNFPQIVSDFPQILTNNVRKKSFVHSASRIIKPFIEKDLKFGKDVKFSTQNKAMQTMNKFCENNFQQCCDKRKMHS